MTVSKMDEYDREPFLVKDKGELFTKPTFQKPRKSLWLFAAIALLSIVIHSGLLLLWMASEGRVHLRHLKCQNHQNFIVSAHPISMFCQDADSKGPFEIVISNNIEMWAEDAWDNSVFMGKPSKELDAAWDELQAGT
jgi:hypothetical protein